MTIEFEIPLEYGVLRGIEFNPGAQRKALAVHGWLDNAASFIPLSKYLPDINLISVDLPGHGFSDHRPKGVNYHLVDYALDVAELIHHLNWKDFDLIGHSLGTGIGCLVASMMSCVGRLYLIDGLGPVTGQRDQTVDRLQRAHTFRLAKGKKPSRQHKNIESAVESRLMVTKMKQASARLIIERNLIHQGTGYSWRTDSRVRLPSPVYMAEDQVELYLRSIESPVKGLRASNGILHKLSSTKDRLDYFQNFSIKDMVGDHHLHMDNPAKVANWLKTS